MVSQNMFGGMTDQAMVTDLDFTVTNAVIV
jgi:hypothetical protein